MVTKTTKGFENSRRQLRLAKLVIKLIAYFVSQKDFSFPRQADFVNS